MINNSIVKNVYKCTGLDANQVVSTGDLKFIGKTLTSYNITSLETAHPTDNQFKVKSYETDFLTKMSNTNESYILMMNCVFDCSMYGEGDYGLVSIVHMYYNGDIILEKGSNGTYKGSIIISLLGGAQLADDTILNTATDDVAEYAITITPSTKEFIIAINSEKGNLNTFKFQSLSIRNNRLYKIV